MSDHGLDKMLIQQEPPGPFVPDAPPTWVPGEIEEIEATFIPSGRTAGGRAAGCSYSGGRVRQINGQPVRYYAGGRPCVPGASRRELDWIRQENEHAGGR